MSRTLIDTLAREMAPRGGGAAAVRFARLLFERVAAELDVGAEVNVPGFGVFARKARRRSVMHLPDGRLLEVEPTSSITLRSAKEQRRQTKEAT